MLLTGVTALAGVGLVLCLAALYLLVRRRYALEAGVDDQEPIVNAEQGYGTNKQNTKASSTPQNGRKWLSGGSTKQLPNVREMEEEDLGKISFRLSYDKPTDALCVHLLEAQGLPSRDMNGESDPYVKVSRTDMMASTASQVFLLPHRRITKVSRVHRRTRNPRFNQTLYFPGHSMRAMADMTLVMQVMDHDRFSRDDAIGEMLMPMKRVKIDGSPVYWRNLRQPSVASETAGEISISLCYLPRANSVTVVVVKAKDLPVKDMCGTSDPYVKLWLFQGGTRLEKRKTTVKPQCLTPVYNESFAFNVPSRERMEKDVNILITVMDHDMITSNDEIGHCVVGAQAGTVGAQHWRDMLENAPHAVTAWHKLSPKW